MNSKTERQEQIILLLARTGFMSSKELANQIGVTAMTIRRDIKELSSLHKIIKSYGGAKPLVSGISIEFSTSQKININVHAKKEIGKKLSKIIEPESTVFLSAGTTLLYAVPYLIEKNLTFVTNSFPSLCKLSNSDCRILCTGGELHKNTGEFLGRAAEKTFDGLNLDYAICSTNGINGNNVTTSNEDEGRIQNIAIAHARHALIIADHTKLDHSDMITFCSLDNFNALVSDNSLCSEVKQKYSKFTKVW